MANSTPSIHDLLPSEILQKIFLLSAPSLSDLLQISKTCRAWRKRIFNPYMIEPYWRFDETHRRKGLLKWWNLETMDDDPTTNPFAPFPRMDCFLGKCVVISGQDIDESENIKKEFQFDIDRGRNFSIAFWCHFDDLENQGLVLVSDDDWDYARSTGIVLDSDNYFSILFQSCISYKTVPSTVKAETRLWYYVVLVQERPEGADVPTQKLWINGKLELTTPIPVAAYAERAIFAFSSIATTSHSMADVSIWSRCLLPAEIRAVYEQKVSINKVDVTKSIFRRIEAERTDDLRQ